jgi:glycosyltransferase involved in cell wall biosynthesis
MIRVPSVSVVIPIYNEAGNIADLDTELRTVLREVAERFEVIYINDGSDDDSSKELVGLAGATVITLNRRYGQATALDAGFAEATGDVIVSLDGDAQNDPRDIPLLLQKMHDEHLDVVAGWRKYRSDKNGIRILTRIGRSLRRMLINDPVHDTGCTLRVYTKEAAKSLSLGGEMHRYILALLRWKGFTIGEVEVCDRPRTHGVSKYGYDKAIRGFIDLLYVWFLYKYSQRPLHLFGYLGLGSFVCAFIAFWIVIRDFFFLNLHLNHDGWFYLFIFFAISGLLFFSFGIVIDLLLKIALTMPQPRKSYIVRSTYRGA